MHHSTGFTLFQMIQVQRGYYMCSDVKGEGSQAELSGESNFGIYRGGLSMAFYNLHMFTYQTRMGKK